MLRGKLLHLNPDLMVADRGERLSQGGDGLAIPQAVSPQAGPVQLANRAQALNVGIMMHDQLTVQGAMYVQLDAVGPKFRGAAEGSERILEGMTRGATVGKDSRRVRHEGRNILQPSTGLTIPSIARLPPEGHHRWRGGSVTHTMKTRWNTVHLPAIKGA